MERFSAAKILGFVAAGILLVGVGAMLGRVDFSASKIAQEVNGFHLLAEVPHRESSSTVSTAYAAKPATKKAGFVASVQAAFVAQGTTTATTASATTTSSTIVFATRTPKIALPIAQDCKFQTNQFPSYENLVLNEIAWMGTPEDSGNEWIELRNASDTAINVGGYWVIDKAEQIKAHLPEKALGPGEFYLLERGDDAVPSSTADFLYTGGMSNSNEGVRLFDPTCTLVDQALAEPKWPAGNTSQKRSMERGGDWLWYSYEGTAVNAIFGTPKAKNTAPNTAAGQYLPPPVVTSTPAIAEAAASSTTSTPELASAANVIVPDAPESDPSTDAGTGQSVTGLDHVVISGVQITGGPGHTTEDFVELYNPLATQFNLKGFRLVKRTKVGTSDTSLKSWTDDAFIPSGGKYRWANTGYPGSADMRTSGSIADDNAVALRQGSEDTGVVIDAVGWGGASNSLVESSPFSTNPTAGQVLTRKQWVDTGSNASDFELR